MRKSLKIFSGIAVLLVVILGIVYFFVTSIPLLPKMEQSKNAVWFDDYYTIEYIDETTIAIGEPRYHQKNYNYLILGEKEAILLDTGPGVRNIKPVVDSITSLPVTVIPSHLHYDHVGSNNQFQRIAAIDIKETTERLKSTPFCPSYFEYLGFIEGFFNKPCFNITDKLRPNQSIDLGNRIITVLHTPGHTTESLMLLDKKKNILFSGDFIYEGMIIAFLPNSDIASYSESSQQLLSVTNDQTRIFPAHSGTTPSSLPKINKKDIVNLSQQLLLISKGDLEGEGFMFKTVIVNNRMKLIYY